MLFNFLKPCPHGVSNARMLSRLHEAFGHLPINIVLLGWDIPPRLEEEIAKETSNHGARLFRWQPWLTRATLNEGTLDWAVIGPDSSPSRDTRMTRLLLSFVPIEKECRIRLQKSWQELLREGCFREFSWIECDFPPRLTIQLLTWVAFARIAPVLQHRKVWISIKSKLICKGHPFPSIISIEIIQSLLVKPHSPENLLDSFLEFRSQSIFDAVEATFRQAHSLGLSIGLDCFSPSLTRMAGQDLSLLGSVSDWIKLMIYPRTFSPAGLSFEIFGLVTWLIRNGFSEPEAINIVSEATGFTFPASISILKTVGV